MAFPTLSYRSIQTEFEDIGIKSKMENGRVISRKRFTKSRKTFTVSINIINQSTLDQLLTHFNEVGTYSTFTFLNPIDDVSYTVRFQSPIQYSKDANIPNYYSVNSFKLVEA